MSTDLIPAEGLRAITEELVRAGVHDVVICPGSRSTPLALALRATSGLRCWVHLDERAGAFFALGAAKAARRPAAILATSGTAVVNFAPAVAEARYGRVPLILLTADRPAELHGRGAPQTIDQVELFGRHAKWFAELPPPEASEAAIAHIREVVTEVVARAVAAPAGPVQLNLPFREPLLPDGPLTDGPFETTATQTPATGLDPADVERAAAMIDEARRGLIVCGPLDAPGFAAAVTKLAARSGFPLFADGLSNVRSGTHERSCVVAHHDALLRSDAVRGWNEPDLVLRFGATPTSKALNQLLDGLEAPQVLIDDGAGWERSPEPTLIDSDPVVFADRLAQALTTRARPTDWLARWQAADKAATDALARWRTRRNEPFEAAIFERLDEAVPDDAIVVVGNSMPVRDLDTFLPASPHQVRCLGNRGANGIDGLISTALGAAAAQERPVVAIVGDVSFLHDLNALVAARRLGLDVTIVLVNNDGGGIFSFLPQASATLPGVGLPERYEELFGTPHGTDFGPLVGALGADYLVAMGDGVAAAVREALGRPGVSVVELRTDRARNVELHRQAFDVVARAAESLR